MIQVLHRGHSALTSGQVRLQDRVICITVGILNNVWIPHTDYVCTAFYDTDVVQGACQCGHTS